MIKNFRAFVSSVMKIATEKMLLRFFHDFLIFIVWLLKPYSLAEQGQVF